MKAKLNLLESTTYKAANACIGLSPGIVKGIKKKVPNKNIAMIPNGCDLNTITRNKKKKNNQLLAVFTGAHGLANGLDAVLSAAAILNEKKEKNIKIQFIGDGMLKPKLMKRVLDEKIENCEFLDPIPKEDLFIYLQKNADVGLMILENIPAFYFGTSPNKFFDYLSLGLPIINNYPGWVSNLINENKCGIAVRPNDPNALAQSLIYLYNNKSLLTEMGMNSKNLAVSQFNRDDLGENFVAFLESVYQK